MPYMITWNGPGGQHCTARTFRAARDTVARLLTDALAADPECADDVADVNAHLRRDLETGSRAVYAVGRWTLTVDPLEL